MDDKKKITNQGYSGIRLNHRRIHTSNAGNLWQYIFAAKRRTGSVSLGEQFECAVSGGFIGPSQPHVSFPHIKHILQLLRNFLKP